MRKTAALLAGLPVLAAGLIAAAGPASAARVAPAPHTVQTAATYTYKTNGPTPVRTTMVASGTSNILEHLAGGQTVYAGSTAYTGGGHTWRYGHAAGSGHPSGYILADALVKQGVPCSS